MEYTLCKIKPRGAFHIGIKEGALEKSMNYIHSDTIFGGLCNTYRLLYGREELEELLDKFKEKPPFLISSAFPYYEQVTFFPLPKSTNFSEYGIEDKYVKKYKKIEFVSFNIIKSLLKNELEKHLDENNIIQGKILVTAEEKEKITENIWKEKETPRVVIDRKTNASNIYYFGEIEYCNKCGLYFLIRFIDKGIKNRIKASIRLLGDEGIGGDRSYGKGLFNADFEKFEWNKGNGRFIVLSLYSPKENEIDMVKDGYYDIITRGGWVYSYDERGERKKFIRMLKEGSTFEGNKEFYGKLIDVTMEGRHHRIYRYGYGMPFYIGGIE